MLAVAVFALPLLPALDYFLPTRQVKIPRLAATGAFSGEVPAFVALVHQNPLPGQPEELKLENHRDRTTASAVMLVWALGALLFAAVRLWHMLNIKLCFARAAPLPPDHPAGRFIQEAAQAAADIGPRVAVPMHMGSANPEAFQDLCECAVVILEP